MALDGLFHFPGRAPPVPDAIVFRVVLVVDEELVRALERHDDHAPGGDAVGDAHHGVLVALVAVQRHQHRPAPARAVDAGKFQLVIASCRAEEELFHRAALSGAWILTQRGGLHGSRQVTSSKLVWNLSSGPEGIPPVSPLLCRTAVVADYFVHGINE